MTIMESSTSLANTVAIAAPSTPNAGNPSFQKINT
jgi:hypothetical protein